MRGKEYEKNYRVDEVISAKYIGVDKRDLLVVEVHAKVMEDNNIMRVYISDEYLEATNKSLEKNFLIMYFVGGVPPEIDFLEWTRDAWSRRGIKLVEMQYS
eukprot:c37091_g1_i1 orf=3-302(-)